MRRIARYIATGLAAVMLMISVAAWVRSYFVPSYASLYTTDPAQSPHTWWGVVSFEGRVYVYRAHRTGFREVGAKRYSGGDGTPLNPHALGETFFGFSAGKMQRTPRSITAHFAIVPFWFSSSMAGAALGYAVLLIRRDRLRRRDPNACKQCGYDLRAGHDKCPECGAESHVPVEAPASAAVGGGRSSR